MNNFSIVREEEVESTKSEKHKLVDAVVKTPSGDEVVWQYVKSRDVVSIVALDNDNNVYCVRQWRPARKGFVWELPAGGIEVENPTEEQVLENANRELQEEIGVKANSLKMLLSYNPTPHTDFTYHIVLARELVGSKLPNDKYEEIEIKKMPIVDAMDLFLNKQKSDSLTLLGIKFAGNYLQEIAALRSQ